MNRVPDQRYAEAIGRALEAIPDRIAERLSTVQFVCGVDPGFVGLHDYDKTEMGPLYSESAHCCYPFNLYMRPPSDRPTTIVLPYVPPVASIVHELGHALHGIVGLDYIAAPVTRYGQTNRLEAFAEAFTTWRFWGYGDEAAFQADTRTVALFDELAA